MTTTIAITMLVVGTLMLLAAFRELVLGSRAVTVPAERWQCRLKLRLLVVAGFLALSTLLTVTGCGSRGDPSACAPGEGDHVRVMINGTVHEPRPMSTGRAVQELHNAAASESATNGSGGKGSSAALLTADGQVFPVTLLVLGGVLLVCVGLLLGWSWTIQALQPTLRRQAGERHRLNEEWSAVRTARRQRGECPRCARPLSERDWVLRTDTGEGRTR